MAASEVVEDGVSHIELAAVNFDQWNLNVSIRKYNNQSVVGMALLSFPWVRGFRFLDEGDLMRFPFSQGQKYYEEVTADGWYQQEVEFGNMIVSGGTREFVVATNNECLCVLCPEEPILHRFSNDDA